MFCHISHSGFCVNHAGPGTSVFLGAGWGPRSRPRCQGCSQEWRGVSGLVGRISASSESSSSASDADAETAAGVLDAGAAC